MMGDADVSADAAGPGPTAPNVPFSPPPGAPGMLTQAAPAPRQKPGLPHEIDELLPYRPGLADYAPHVALGLVLAVLAAAFIWFLLRRRQRPALVPPPDPWRELEAALARVEIEPPFPRKAQEEAFYRMSLLLREAVELKLGLRATDQTLSELQAPLRARLPLAVGPIEELLAFLARADLVKFAESSAQRSEAEAAKVRVGEWISALQKAPLFTPAAAAEEAPGALFGQEAGAIFDKAAAPSAPASADGADRTKPPAEDGSALVGLPSERRHAEGQRAPR